MTKPSPWRSWPGTDQLSVLPAVSSVCCVYGTSTPLHVLECCRSPLTGLEKAWMKRGSLLPHHPSPCPTSSSSFCELKYLQSKEMPSRVNKGGAAPVVGGPSSGRGQPWVGRSPGLHLFVLQLSGTHLCTGTVFPLVLGAQEALGATPSGLCLCVHSEGTQQRPCHKPE